MIGYWNGERLERVRPLTYEVGESDVITHWNNAFIGDRRHGLELTYKNETWIIDNQHGDGYSKITIGLGNPAESHKSVFNPQNIIYTKDSEGRRDFDIEGIRRNEKIEDDYIKLHDPEAYEKLIGLKNLIRGSNLESKTNILKEMVMNQHELGDDQPQTLGIPQIPNPVYQPMYYIQSGYVGNAVSWWRIDSKGHTTDITEAQKYTESEAKSILKNRKGDKAWLCSHVDNNQEAHKMVIDSQYLDGKYQLKEE